MDRKLPRREFLRRTASLAAVAPLTDAFVRSPTVASAKAGPPAAAPGYPIRGLRFTDVRLTDDFWRPKIALNARVTIPQLAARDGGRGLEGNVLEAA
ncbi:MAG TPA: hypothetical protein VH138_18455, partial [Vicinamibacterales bacterium]|nr:hypothetical protein [Vicinamibacterales bacterium]